MARWVAARDHGAFPRLLVLLALLLAGFSFRGLHATSEGDALFSMMNKWNVPVPISGWVSGGDPCASGQRWEGVTCRNGMVVELNVTNLGIDGPFPDEIGQLTGLEVLDISNLYNVDARLKNQFSGGFPESLAQCTGLKSFNGSNIAWDISFPTVLSKLTNLEELYLSAANITGSIPDEFFNLASLRYLFLGNNKLTGTLDNFARLTSLVVLTANQNSIEGSLPPSLSSLQKLEYINCHTCNLYGPLPNEYSKLKSLRNVTMHRNSFTGSVPISWSNLTNMRGFRIDMNYLSGPFPSFMINDWPQLDSLILSKNSFSEEAPNFTALDTVSNVSYKYSRLKWDCNYLNGASPCSEDEPRCSNNTLSVIEDGKDFDFLPNCYDNSDQSSLDNVRNDCDKYHPTGVTCDSFYGTLRAGNCPECPENQVLDKTIAPNGPNGNCVCTLDKSSSGKHGVTVGVVVGIVLGTVALFTAVIVFVMYRRRKHFAFLDKFLVKDPEDNAYWEIPPGVERFSLHELAKITHNFSDANMIGQGGFGKVFVGTLENGKQVAIKRASAGGMQGTVEFKNEISLLSRLHHRHLVKLEGFCDEENLQILVYEFMTRGNLHSHLLGKITTTPLTWYKRLEIAYEVALGLEYLHSFADPPVIHRDVKPTNILLDDHMTAKLADFGISKVSPEYDTHVSTRPAGTAGYLDPDYFMRRQLTTASDVYAYGVVLLELVTGQEAIDHLRLEEFNLVEWVKKRFITRGVVSIVDHQIEHDYSPEAFAEMTLLGLKCSSFQRNERPTMKVVLATLTPFMKAPQKHHSEPDMETLQEVMRRKKGSFETESGQEKTLLDSHQKGYLSDSNRFHRSSFDQYTQRSTESESEPNKALMSENLGPR